MVGLGARFVVTDPINQHGLGTSTHEHVIQNDTEIGIGAGRPIHVMGLRTIDVKCQAIIRIEQHLPDVESTSFISRARLGHHRVVTSWTPVYSILPTATPKLQDIGFERVRKSITPPVAYPETAPPTRINLHSSLIIARTKTPL